MTMRVSEFLSRLCASVKGGVKIVIQSRPSGVRRAEQSGPLVILANGPSLRQTIDSRLESLRSVPSLAVNFAANAPEFQLLRPRYYVLADPHFFVNAESDNVSRLWRNLSLADWDMTLFVPVRYVRKSRGLVGERVRVCRFNAVGIEGFHRFEHWAFSCGLAMPRPRNVLIPSIMIGLGLGYNEIYLAGADHSWLRTISVNDANEVVSVQPHFYKEEAGEQARVVSEYRDYRLHDILDSFRIAFRSYHAIRRYADRIGARVYNATAGSFIDAFERRQLP